MDAQPMSFLASSARGFGLSQTRGEAVMPAQAGIQ
jgi:hypothetical protein